MHIADRLREKASIRSTATELGRSPSTISWEVRRNRTDGTRKKWHYRPFTAQARADWSFHLATSTTSAALSCASSMSRDSGSGAGVE